jgi:hypothetical protein
MQDSQFACIRTPLAQGRQLAALSPLRSSAGMLDGNVGLCPGGDTSPARGHMDRSLEHQ